MRRAAVDRLPVKDRFLQVANDRSQFAAECRLSGRGWNGIPRQYQPALLLIRREPEKPPLVGRGLPSARFRHFCYYSAHTVIRHCCRTRSLSNFLRFWGQANQEKYSNPFHMAYTPTAMLPRPAARAVMRRQRPGCSGRRCDRISRPVPLMIEPSLSSARVSVKSFGAPGDVCCPVGCTPWPASDHPGTWGGAPISLGSGCVARCVR